MGPQAFIAHYRITSKLGEGGMGVVYRATDTKLNRDVAIKVLPDSFAGDPDRLERFTREARVLASLNHPNIAAIYGVEERALVMELVEGRTLAERIARGAMPLEDALPLVNQLVEGLEYAHEKGVVHRDLKPANIKVTPEGRLKILDFGLAKAFSAESSAGNPEISPTLTMRATLAGVIMGTAGYMAPEQARGHAVDKRADIWAFGVVLYEMLTGGQLFGGATVSETLSAVLKQEPELGRVPPKLGKLLRLCLTKDPRLRLRDIGDVRALIDDASIAPGAEPRHSLLPWALAAAMGLALAVLAAIHFRERPLGPMTAPPVVRFQIAPPGGGAFYGRSLALSPDGRQLAFTARTKSGRSLLWVRALDSPEARALPDTENAAYPFWAPDGRSLAFWAGGRLKRIESSGPGPVQTLCNVTSMEGGDWSRDGVILLGTLDDGILRVPQAGGEPARITTPDRAHGERMHGFPQALPDGRHYLYLSIAPEREDASGVYVASFDGKERKRLAGTKNSFSYAPPSGTGRPGHLLFLRDDVLMAQPLNPESFELAGEAFSVAHQVASMLNWGFFAVSNGVLAYRSGVVGGAQLTWFDRTGKPVGSVGEHASYSDIALSPDGSRVAVEQISQTSSANIWLIDVAHGVPTQFTFDEGHYDFDPVWSPDGNRVAFSSDREGPAGLHLKESSGARPEERLHNANVIERPCGWSRDGRFLMYVRRGRSFNLWVLSDLMEDPAKRKAAPYLETPFNATQCQFSPDSRWVAYTSDESRHGSEIYVQSFPGGAGRFLVSQNGGVQPRWRRDGTELFYASADGKLMAVDVKTAPTFQAGIPHVLFDAGIVTGSGYQFAFRYDVAPDGQRFLVNNAQAGGGELITVVTNWEAGLKR